MNGHFSIELAFQHQQELVDYAAESRLAARRSPTLRLGLAARWPRWRSARSSVGGASAPQLASACSHR